MKNKIYTGISLKLTEQESDSIAAIVEHYNLPIVTAINEFTKVKSEYLLLEKYSRFLDGTLFTRAFIAMSENLFLYDPIYLAITEIIKNPTMVFIAYNNTEDLTFSVDFYEITIQESYIGKVQELISNIEYPNACIRIKAGEVLEFVPESLKHIKDLLDDDCLIHVVDNIIPINKKETKISTQAFMV